MDKKVSVIMPVYNCEKLLEKGVKSILGQTYKNLELILINDGSTDNSGAVCDGYAKSDSRVKVIHKENGGPSAARNAGLIQAVGEYVYFIDSDDELKPHGIASMLKAMQENNVDLVICGYNLINGNEVKNVYIEEEIVADAKNADIFLKVYNKIMFNSLWNKFYKKEKIRHRFNEGIKWGEDFEFNLEYLKNIDKYMVIEERLYNYYIYMNNNSLTSMSIRKKYDQNLLSIPNRIKLINDIFPSNKEILSATCGDFTNVSKDLIRDIVINTQNYKSAKKELETIIKNPLLKQSLKVYRPKSKNDKLLKVLFKFKVSWLLYKLYKIKTK